MLPSKTSLDTGTDDICDNMSSSTSCSSTSSSSAIYETIDKLEQEITSMKKYIKKLEICVERAKKSALRNEESISMKGKVEEQNNLIHHLEVENMQLKKELSKVRQVLEQLEKQKNLTVHLEDENKQLKELVLAQNKSLHEQINQTTDQNTKMTPKIASRLKKKSDLIVENK